MTTTRSQSHATKARSGAPERARKHPAKSIEAGRKKRFTALDKERSTKTHRINKSPSNERKRKRLEPKAESTTQTPANHAEGKTDHHPHRADAIHSTLHILLSRLHNSTSTICPSQIPRALHDAHPREYPDWRAMMDEVREAVWEEVRKGRVEVTQGGEVRRWEERGGIRGPIRVRRGREWDQWDAGGDGDGDEDGDGDVDGGQEQEKEKDQGEEMDEGEKVNG